MIKAVFARLKQLTSVQHPLSNRGFMLLPRTRFDYEKETQPAKNSIVEAAIGWAGRHFPEAPIILKQRSNQDEWETLHDDPMLDMLENPNPFYSGVELWKATIADYILFGNSYWLKVRNGSGQVIQLWWIPQELIQPAWPTNNPSIYISHYDYTPGTETQRLEVTDVVHFRQGIDPANVRKGLSPMQSLFREVFTDDEAANATASLLRNTCVPGIVISPATDGAYVDPDVAEATKKEFSQRFSGDRRGEPLVMTGPTNVHSLGFTPEQMEMRELRGVPEERITAVLGINSAVLGLGSGLSSTKVGATLKEYREEAYEGFMIPLYRDFAGQMGKQLLPDFKTDSRRWQVGFDVTQVRVLQEDENARAERVRGLLNGGVVTVGEARQQLGYEAGPEHEVYYVPGTLKRVPPDELATPEEPEPAPAMPANGNQPAQRGWRPTERKELNQRQQRLILTLARDEEQLEAAFAGRLANLFDGLASGIANAYRRTAPERSSYQPNGRKAPSDEIRVLAILREFDLAAWVAGDLTPAFEAHYLLTAEKVWETVGSSLELSLSMTDDFSHRVLAEGGKRVGLLDLDADVRKNLFDTLEAARIEGLGVDDTASRIRETVGKGRWKSSRIRSEVIAREETIHAMRLSSMEAYKSSGITQVQLLDNQTGYNDEECSARDGSIVTFDEANLAIEGEHIRGTLALVPVVE